MTAAKTMKAKTGAMICPNCQAMKTRVIDSRVVKGATRRRRVCKRCRQRWTTYEITDKAFQFLREQIRVLRAVKDVA